MAFFKPFLPDAIFGNAALNRPPAIISSRCVIFAIYYYFIVCKIYCCFLAVVPTFGVGTNYELKAGR